jgi:sirohydrochlorin ferrochelatase
MKALLLVAHGSRRQQSNDEVDKLAEQLRERCGEEYQIVHSAFLELADTLIPDGIRRCAQEGATEIVVLPYFLNSGRHVVTDIPEEVDSVRDELPGVEIKLASHLGASSVMLDLLVDTAHSTA